LVADYRSHFSYLLPHYFYLLRVYIEPLELHSQLSRLCISTLCKAYSYKPGSHCLLTNYLDRTTCCTINLLPHLRSHYFFHLCKCFEPLPGTSLVLVIIFKYQTDGRRTSIILNIDHIKHWKRRISNILNIDYIKHWSYQTSIMLNIEYIEHRSNWTWPYDPWPTDERTNESN